MLLRNIANATYIIIYRHAHSLIDRGDMLTIESNNSKNPFKRIDQKTEFKTNPKVLYTHCSNLRISRDVTIGLIYILWEFPKIGFTRISFNKSNKIHLPKEKARGLSGNIDKWALTKSNIDTKI